MTLNFLYHYEPPYIYINIDIQQKFLYIDSPVVKLLIYIAVTVHVKILACGCSHEVARSLYAKPWQALP